MRQMLLATWFRCPNGLDAGVERCSAHSRGVSGISDRAGGLDVSEVLLDPTLTSGRTRTIFGRGLVMAMKLHLACDKDATVIQDRVMRITIRRISFHRRCNHGGHLPP
jgi:hypothetical protein